jgi:translation initiation factor IF-1
MRPLIPALVSFAVAAAGWAAAQEPTPTPVEQHVVAPSLPDQPNKEGVVRPSGSMPTDSEGYVRTNRGVIDPTSTTSPAPSGTVGQATVTGPVAVEGAPVTVSAPPSPGKSKVKAAHLSVRGTVKAYEKGVSITVVEADGRERAAKIAAKASVYEGLAVGDKVIVRIPVGKPADGKTTDHVERQKPPKPPPKSKFTQAQSPAS